MGFQYFILLKKQDNQQCIFRGRTTVHEVRLLQVLDALRLQWPNRNGPKTKGPVTPDIDRGVRTEVAILPNVTETRTFQMYQPLPVG